VFNANFSYISAISWHERRNKIPNDTWMKYMPKHYRPNYSSVLLCMMG